MLYQLSYTPAVRRPLPPCEKKGKTILHGVDRPSDGRQRSPYGTGESSVGRVSVVKMMAAVAVLALAAAPGSAIAADAVVVPELGANLERFTYPWPVQTMTFDVVGQPATMRRAVGCGFDVATATLTPATCSSASRSAMPG